MATKLDTINTALALVGGNEINSVTDMTREARVSNRIYTMVRPRLITEHPWRFTMAQRQLNQLVTTPLFNYNYAYQLPSDVLRIKKSKDLVDYEVLDGTLYCNNAELFIQYQYGAVEANEPPYFTEVLVYELVLLLEAALNRDKEEVAVWDTLLGNLKRKARNTDSQIQPVPKLDNSQFELLRARAGGS